MAQDRGAEVRARKHAAGRQPGEAVVVRRAIAVVSCCRRFGGRARAKSGDRPIGCGAPGDIEGQKPCCRHAQRCSRAACLGRASRPGDPTGQNDRGERDREDGAADLPQADREGRCKQEPREHLGTQATAPQPASGKQREGEHRSHVVGDGHGRFGRSDAPEWLRLGYRAQPVALQLWIERGVGVTEALRKEKNYDGADEGGKAGQRGQPACRRAKPRRHGGDDRQADAGNYRRHKLGLGEGIALRAEPVRRGDGRGEGGHRRKRQPTAEPDCQRPLRLTLYEKGQRDRATAGDDIGQSFHADREHKRGRRAGQQTPPHRCRFGRQEMQHRKDENELEIVVIDRAGGKDVDEVERGGAHHGSRQRRRIARDRACATDDEDHCCDEQGHRPGDQRERFRHRHISGGALRRHDDQRDRQIDQPRPVHDETALGSHAVLMQVEPALSAKQVADLDHPQEAVIVAPRVVEAGESAPPVKRHEAACKQERKRKIAPQGNMTV